MTAPIDVSVIIAAYEAAELIRPAIKACLAQTDIELEVIVIDDGSAIPCEAAVAEAANGDPRVKYIGLAQNTGPSGARNAGLEAAQGTYIAVLDADDAMLPGRLGTLIDAARTHKADIVVDNMFATSDLSDAAARKPFLLTEQITAPTDISLETYIDPASDEAFGRPLGYLKPLIARQFLENHGFRYDLTLTNSEDYYLIAHMLAAGAKMVLLPYTGYIYFTREGSISYRLNPKQTAAILAAEKQFQDQYAARLSPAAKAASARRWKVMSRVHAFETLVDDLRQRAPFRFLRDLFSNPFSAPGHMAAFTGIAARKLFQLVR